MTDKKVLVPGPDHPISLAPTGARVTVKLGSRVIADTTNAITLREASYPAVQYVPLADVDPRRAPAERARDVLPLQGRGVLLLGRGRRRSSRRPRSGSTRHRTTRSRSIRDHAAFYPDRVDSIEVHRAA